MKVVQVTFVPNVLFDEYLPYLSESELKVLLVIIRQTNGWQRRDGCGRKCRDWIATAQFRAKTGLSAKSVSTAIQKLVARRLIVVSDSEWKMVQNPPERKGYTRLYYSLAPGVQKERESERRSGQVVQIQNLLANRMSGFGGV